MKKQKELGAVNSHFPKYDEVVALYRRHMITKLNRKYIKDLCNYDLDRVEVLIYNKSCHFVSVFKDYLIWDYQEEFLQRKYKLGEAKEKIAHFVEFYRSYLTFFCRPLFTSLNLNQIVQEHGERRAECYYNQNYKQGNDTKENEESHCNEDRRKEEAVQLDGTIFNSEAKEIIEDSHCSLSNKKVNETCQSSLSLSNATMVNESTLLDAHSNNCSIRNIMNQLKKRSSRQNAQRELQLETQEKVNRVHLSYKSIEPKAKTVTPLIPKQKDEHINHHPLKRNEVPHNLTKKLTPPQLKGRSRNEKGAISNTYDIPNKREMTKTRSLESLISGITQLAHSNLHSKNVQSTKPQSKGNSAMMSFLLKKGNMRVLNIIPKNTHLEPKQKSSSSRAHKANSTNDINQHQRNCTGSSNYKEELVKFSLDLLINSSKLLKTSSSQCKIKPIKTIHNVNIQINNQIHINNNFSLNHWPSGSNCFKQSTYKPASHSKGKPKNAIKKQNKKSEDNQRNKNLVLFSSSNRTKALNHKSSRNMEQINYQLSQLTGSSNEINTKVTFTSGQLIQVHSQRKVFSKEKPKKPQYTHK